jgi:DNA-directed RNA polymerase specialized sigma24 family protein
MTRTYSALSERQELEPDTSLFKTYLREAHSHSPCDPKMNIAELFEKYDGRLRANVARLGVASPMDQEDIAQGVWAKLAARKSPPKSPGDWIFSVARNDVIRHGRREGRRRAWTAAAAQRRTAVSARPFGIDHAIDTVRPRLSDREEEIMVAAMTTRTDRDLAKALGYPTVKIAQSARSRLRTRITDILREEVDVSFMYELLEGYAPTAPASEPVTRPLPEIPAEAPQTSEPSPRYARTTLKRARVIDALGAQAREVTDPSDWFGSFAEHFARCVTTQDERALWARALDLPDDEIDRIASGRRTMLELDPDLAALAGLLLGIRAEDAAGMALADVGLRPVMGAGEAALKEELLPAEEATVRIRALMVEDELLRA